MKTITASLLLLGTLASFGAHASEELLKKNNCMACHAVDKKLVGPGYKQVAERYAGKKQDETVAMLVNKVKKGGSGTWGPIPMPANPQISDQDAKTVVTYILSLK